MKKLTKQELKIISNNAKTLLGIAKIYNQSTIELGPEWLNIVIVLCRMAKKDFTIPSNKIKK